MFIFLVVLSVLLVALAILLYRVNPYAWLSVFAVVAFLGFGILSISVRSLMLVFPCLLATWAVCRWRDVSRQSFAAFATLSVAAGWLSSMLLFIPRWNEIQNLAADYPIVRIDERLAYERGPTALTDFPQPSPAEGFPTEADLANASDMWSRYGNDRVVALASLEHTHDAYTDAFVSQEGFGWVRMRFLPARDEYIRVPEPEPLALAPSQPPSDSAAETQGVKSFAHGEMARDYHGEQALEFVNPKTYGYAVDGEWDVYGRSGASQVRGFQPHAFRDLPAGSPAGDDWQLARLELVSLLKHDPPAVYLSEHLPRMQELASNDAPTRSLNEFEARSLKRLFDGETIVAEESRNRVTMVGGLRAARQCLQCHSVGEGHLLGAFSYEFFRKEPLPPQDEKPKPTKPVT